MKPHSQNLSIMITDIQGYTNTSVNSSRQEILELIRRHNKLIKPVIEFYEGHIVKTMGDAFLCTFFSATDAVVAAIVIQKIFSEYNRNVKDDSKKLSIRIVVNTGDVTLEEDDIFGDAVNIAARMEGLDCYPGGSVGISESTFLLMNRNEIVTEKIGEKVLKGIPFPVTVYSVPLDKQKIERIPARVFDLVRMAASNETKFEDQKYSSNVNEFLKDKKISHSDSEEEIGNMVKNAIKLELNKKLGSLEDKFKTKLKESIDNKNSKDNTQNDPKNNKDIHINQNNYIFPAFLFIGFAIGFLIRNVSAGMFIGIGSAFIYNAVFSGMDKNRSILPGFVILGLGIGFLSHHVNLWLFLGIGLGFLGVPILKKIKNKKSKN